MKRLLYTVPFVLVFLAAAIIPSAGAQAPVLTAEEQLGKLLFFDTNLSDPVGQSCASCHDPKAGFSGPTSSINAHGAAYPGAIDTRFGNRKPPTAAYGGDSPVLHYDAAEEVWIGGMFWDGRATGLILGDPLAEQAQGPFLNPVEQNLASAQAACETVAVSAYLPSYEALYGPIDCITGVAVFYENIARAIAAYERSVEVNPFSSKYDAYLAGKAKLTKLEAKGLALYEGKGMCSACHPNTTEDGSPPLFTDFTFDNLGVPRNPENPWYMQAQFNPDGDMWVDPGLGGFLKNAGYGEEVYSAELGKHKVPTLRNVDLRPAKKFVKAYGHNGVFKTLEQIVHFYNTRDTLPPCDTMPNAGTLPLGKVCWEAPEVPDNVNVDELGNLGLTPAEEKAIVAFLKTLSDGYFVP